jgi:hypothetical protein
MGSLARMDRSSRFVDEFTEDFAPTCPLQPGQTLTVMSVGLGTGSVGEEVKLGVHLADEQGRDYELEFADVLFDPGVDDQDVMRLLCDHLGFSEAEAIRRLRKAGLWGQ